MRIRMTDTGSLKEFGESYARRLIDMGRATAAEDAGTGRGAAAEEETGKTPETPETDGKPGAKEPETGTERTATPETPGAQEPETAAGKAESPEKPKRGRKSRKGRQEAEGA